MFRVKSPQDFGAAVTFIVIGAAGLYFGREYSVGSAARMGPGYFPMLLSYCLIAIGAFVGFKSIATPGPSIALPKWRSSILLLAAIIVFGALIERAGLAPTVAICSFIAAFATTEAKVKETAVLSILLAAFVVFLFIYALNQPMQIFGGD
jgi:hypothetical protein